LRVTPFLFERYFGEVFALLVKDGVTGTTQIASYTIHKSYSREILLKVY